MTKQIPNSSSAKKSVWAPNLGQNLHNNTSHNFFLFYAPVVVIFARNTFFFGKFFSPQLELCFQNHNGGANIIGQHHMWGTSCTEKVKEFLKHWTCRLGKWHRCKEHCISFQKILRSFQENCTKMHLWCFSHDFVVLCERQTPIQLLGSPSICSLSLSGEAESPS